MTALVTGAGGFLGFHVVEQLAARGERVRAMCRRESVELAALGVEIVRADLLDRDAVARACAGVDVVHHVAGVAGVWGPRQRYYDVNVRGTHHVLDGCRRHGVGRLVYTSSPSVTFDGGDQCGIDESAPYSRQWLNAYQETKALAEQLVLAAHGRDGLTTCALRPHLIWGPRDRHLIPRLVDRARRGKLVRVGDGRNLIDTVHADNAALAHLLAADALALGAPCGGRTYFISQGTPVNCWQWIDELLGLAGLPPVRRAISARTAWRIGAAMEAAYRLFGIESEPRMTRFLAAQLSRSHYFDISAARRDFGYAPHTSTAEGMRRLAAALARSDADVEKPNAAGR